MQLISFCNIPPENIKKPLIRPGSIEKDYWHEQYQVEINFNLYESKTYTSNQPLTY